MRALAFVAVAALAAAAASLALAAPAANKLVGTDGPGFTITLVQAGKAVKKLHPGAYTITVNDKADIHNFHLMGPGVNKSTTVPFKGTQTWKVVLKKGTYTYQCDPHAAGGMKGSFKVA